MGPKKTPITMTRGARPAPASVALSAWTRTVVNDAMLSGRLSLDDFIAIGELDPGLLPASPCASWAAARMYRLVCRLERGPRHPSAFRKSRSRTPGKRAQ